MSLNRVILLGRLTSDPILKYTPQGTAVATFTLAVPRKFKREETDFINCVVWAKPAENAAQYLKKGSQCAIEGRIQVRNYEDSEGKKRYVTEVVAEDVRFLDSKSKESKPAENDGWDDVARNVDDVDLVDESDSDIPF